MTQNSTDNYITVILDKTDNIESATVKIKSIKTKKAKVINNSDITDMAYLFSDCRSKELDLSEFDTSKVTNMNSMFRDCKLNKLDISKFDTANVVSMESMFERSNIKELVLGSLNTSNVKKASKMFEGSKTNSIDISNFDFSKTEYMNRMFCDCKSNNITMQGVTTSRLKSMKCMFENCNAKDINLKGVCTSSVTNMENMFKGAKTSSLDLRSFNTSKVTTMKDMFMNCNCENILLDSFNVKSIKLMTRMFYNCKAKSLQLANLMVYYDAQLAKKQYEFYNLLNALIFNFFLDPKLKKISSLKLPYSDSLIQEINELYNIRPCDENGVPYVIRLREPENLQLLVGYLAYRRLHFLLSPMDIPDILSMLIVASQPDADVFKVFSEDLIMLDMEKMEFDSLLSGMKKYEHSNCVGDRTWLDLGLDLYSRLIFENYKLKVWEKYKISPPEFVAAISDVLCLYNTVDMRPTTLNINTIETPSKFLDEVVKFWEMHKCTN